MNQPKFKVSDSRTADKFVLRLPDGMREAIAAVAQNNHRSMNSEIIARLEHSLVYEEEAALIRVDAQSLSPTEQHLVKSFRSLSSLHQKALVELMTLQPKSAQAVSLVASQVA